jgi:hypothetical protein
MIQSRPTAPRSFTVRVPAELYLEICECSTEDDVPINVKVNQLIKLGLGKQVSLNEALRKMVMKLITEDEHHD